MIPNIPTRNRARALASSLRSLEIDEPTDSEQALTVAHAHALFLCPEDHRALMRLSGALDDHIALSIDPDRRAAISIHQLANACGSTFVARVIAGLCGMVLEINDNGAPIAVEPGTGKPVFIDLRGWDAPRLLPPLSPPPQKRLTPSTKSRVLDFRQDSWQGDASQTGKGKGAP